MRYCHCDDLRSGMVLAKPLHASNGELLLARGYELNEMLITRIRRMRISYVCVEAEGTEEITIPDLVPARTLGAAGDSLKVVYDEVLATTRRRARDSVEDVVQNLPYSRLSVPLVQVKKTVVALIDDLLDNMIRHWDTMPPRFVTGDHFQHGVDVAILSLLIGMHFQIRKELRSLGLAALLHDLGKSLLTNLENRRRCDLTAEELELYAKHPRLGADMLAGLPDTLFIERECVLQHHEQPDGKGFPQGLKSDGRSPAREDAPHAGEIYRLAEIIHVADAYANLTSGAWQPVPRAPEEALAELIKGTPEQYNRAVVEALQQVVVLFPKGAMVRLLEHEGGAWAGYLAVIAEPNRRHPHRPQLVIFADPDGRKIPPVRLDLADDPAGRLKLIL
ncbi:MAG: HD domain-containing protein [Candidatus Zixiibacteriota bacterium]|nr:MAG: HD domain-containing protein [candidate division Zixibacteria bacterium]